MDNLSKFKKALSSKKVKNRLEAVMGLRDYLTTQANKLLIKALGDPNQEVRLLAANILMERAYETKELLLEALAHPKWMVRKLAATILATIGEDIVDDLIQALSIDNDDVRYWAAYALSSIGGSVAKDAILKAVEEGRIEEGWLPRILVAFPEDERVGDILIKILKSKRWHNRKEAANALERIARLNADVKEKLISMITSSNDDESYWALQIIGKLALTEEELVEKIANYLESTDDDMRKEFCIDALAKTKSKKAARVLVKYLDQDVWSIQRRVADALISMGEEIFDVLQDELLKSNNDEIRYWILRVLHEQKTQRAKQLFKSHLNDKNPKIRTVCILALADLGDLEDKKQLLNLLKDEDPEVRKTVIVALSNEEDEAIKEGLKKALEDEDETVREYAKTVIGE